MQNNEIVFGRFSGYYQRQGAVITMHNVVQLGDGSQNLDVVTLEPAKGGPESTHTFLSSATNLTTIIRRKPQGKVNVAFTDDCWAGYSGAGAPAITVPDESFTIEGKMLNLELTDSAGVVTVEGIAGRYGRVFLTYNMTMNPNSDSQGAFTGRGMGISDEGVRQAGSR